MKQVFICDGMQYVLENIGQMPQGGPRSRGLGTGKWEWLRQAVKDMTPDDEPLGLTCLNKHEAECARTALNNMCRPGKIRGNAATRLSNPDWIIQTVVKPVNGNPDGKYKISFCVIER